MNASKEIRIPICLKSISTGPRPKIIHREDWYQLMNGGLTIGNTAIPETIAYIKIAPTTLTVCSLVELAGNQEAPTNHQKATSEKTATPNAIPFPGFISILLARFDL
jgi:hypothetical protein